MEGQHQSPFELVSTNICACHKQVGVQRLHCQHPLCKVQDWLALYFDKDEEICCLSSPLMKTGFKGRPKFDIPHEELQYLIDIRFKATDIAKMLCISKRPVYRRLEENGYTSSLILDTKACAVTYYHVDIKCKKIEAGNPWEGLILRVLLSEISNSGDSQII